MKHSSKWTMSQERKEQCKGEEICMKKIIDHEALIYVA